jgi:hypothetical protein
LPLPLRRGDRPPKQAGRVNHSGNRGPHGRRAIITLSDLNCGPFSTPRKVRGTLLKPASQPSLPALQSKILTRRAASLLPPQQYKRCSTTSLPQLITRLETQWRVK